MWLRLYHILLRRHRWEATGQWSKGYLSAFPVASEHFDCFCGATKCEITYASTAAMLRADMEPHLKSYFDPNDKEDW